MGGVGTAHLIQVGGVGTAYHLGGSGRYSTSSKIGALPYVVTKGRDNATLVCDNMNQKYCGKNANVMFYYCSLCL